VLRRGKRRGPLSLAGVTLDSTFFPRSHAEGEEPLVLNKGLVALAPLDAVTAETPAAAAADAMVDAEETWNGENAPREGSPPER
jgi:hypothetical protein